MFDGLPHLLRCSQSVESDAEFRADLSFLPLVSGLLALMTSLPLAIPCMLPPRVY